MGNWDRAILRREIPACAVSSAKFHDHHKKLHTEMPSAFSLFCSWISLPASSIVSEAEAIEAFSKALLQYICHRCLALVEVAYSSFHKISLQSLLPVLRFSCHTKVCSIQNTCLPFLKCRSSVSIHKLCTVNGDRTSIPSF